MSRCAAGHELPKRGACYKCGARSDEPCPEALRIAREERETLIRSLEQIEYASRKDSLTDSERLESVRVVVNRALALVGASEDSNG